MTLQEKINSLVDTTLVVKDDFLVSKAETDLDKPDNKVMFEKLLADAYVSGLPLSNQNLIPQQ